MNQYTRQFTDLEIASISDNIVSDFTKFADAAITQSLKPFIDAYNKKQIQPIIDALIADPTKIQQVSDSLKLSVISSPALSNPIEITQ